MSDDTRKPTARERTIERLTEWSSERGPDPLSEHAMDVRLLLSMIADGDTEVDRLRARVAELEAAGNRVADQVRRFLVSPESHDDRAKLRSEAQAWRAVRRGDR